MFTVFVLFTAVSRGDKRAVQIYGRLLYTIKWRDGRVGWRGIHCPGDLFGPL